MDLSQRVLLTMLAPAVTICAAAQVTTSSIGGVVTDSEKVPLEGASIRAKHLPSGTVYRAVSNKDGRYTIQGMRPGGPYEVQVSYVGLAPKRFEKLYAELGNNLQLDVWLMPTATQLGEAVITANRKVKTGAGANFSMAKITSTPSINHSVYDVIKNSPLTTKAKNGGISFMGTSNRYNSFQIDGVVANDVFGLSSDGTNGGQTGANPISTDAIEEIQVVVAPYDVRQGGFTGGGINAVTKSGTNTFHGSGYSYFNNQNMYGRYSALRDYERVPMTDQYDRTFGGTVGGPIIKDKLFFFASVEHRKKSFPTAIYPGYSKSYMTVDVAKEIEQHYFDLTGNHDSYGSRNVNSNSLGLLARIDWNINDAHHLNFRYQMNDSDKESYSASTRRYTFNNSAYDRTNQTHSFVTELTSRLTDKLHNEFRASATYVRDDCDVPYQGPTVRIRNVKSEDDRTKMDVNIGTEYSHGANNLKQDTYSLEDNLTWYLGDHNVTLGTHNEMYRMANLFIQGNNGSWTFNSLKDFMAGKANQFSYNFTDPKLTGGDLLYAPVIKAGQFGAYVQDKWNVSRNFNFTYGLRVDLPKIFNKPMVNEAFNKYAADQGMDAVTGRMPKVSAMVSPRLGFNLYLDKDHKTLLRGGTGIFTGRVPFVWLSNAFKDNGMQMKSLNIRGKDIPLLDKEYKESLADIRKKVDAGDFRAGKPNISVVSRDFKYPQVFRSNLALEQVLPGDVKMTIEGIYSKTLNNVFFENLAIKQAGEVYAVPGVKNSAVPYYNIERSDYYSIINLKNTNKGYSYALSMQLEKSFDFGLNLAASYTYGHSKSVNDGTSSVAYSNWKYNYSRNTNGSGELGYTKYDVPNRVMVRANWRSKKYFGGWTSTEIGVIYNGSNGGRYSLTMYDSQDFNGDGQRSNNLLYIPTKEELARMKFTADNGMDADQNRAAFEEWIENDSYAKKHRGQYAVRNSNQTHWENTIDLHFGQKVYLKNLAKLEFTVDVMNFANMLNKRWGGQYGNVYSVSPLAVQEVKKIGAEEYTPIYSYNRNYINKSDVFSRWHMQLGVKVTF